MNNLYDGAGCQWWSHVGVAMTETSTYPSNGQGGSVLAAAYASSALFGAKVVVIYKIHVATGAAADTLAIGIESGGTLTALTGFSALDVGTTGAEYEFPGGLRIEHGSNANIGVTTNDATTVTVFYRKIA